jgi:acyl-CoA thioester hydrolase
MFELPIRVYWEDTDAGGVVYHAQYLAFLERARSDWLRTEGHGQDGLRRTHDLVFAVRAMTLDFLAPARLDDLLAVDVRVAEVRSASLVLAQRIRRDAAVLFTAEVRLAALCASTFRPCPIPSPLLAAFRALAAHAPESPAASVESRA